jgi:hypothetical protein
MLSSDIANEALADTQWQRVARPLQAVATRAAVQRLPTNALNTLVFTGALHCARQAGVDAKL